MKVRSAVHRRAFDAFEDEDVEIAYPHTHHVFDETSGRARVGVESLSSGPEAGSGVNRASATGTNVDPPRKRTPQSGWSLERSDEQPTD
nr:hypothetical protein [Natronorubrum halophilum]